MGPPQVPHRWPRAGAEGGEMKVVGEVYLCLGVGLWG